MLHKYRSLTGIVGVALIVVYSIVMMATEGSAAWAWLILVAAFAVLIAAWRGGLADRESHDA